MTADRAVFLLSGEGSALPRAELKALVETYGFSKLQEYNPRLFLVEGCKDSLRVAQRGAYVRWSGHYIAELKLKDLPTAVSKIEFGRVLPKFHSFRVSVTKLSTVTGQRLEAEIGREIKSQIPGSRVSLQSPDVVVSVILFMSGTDEDLEEEKSSVILAYNGLQSPKRWKERRPRTRPFFHPSALFPKLARAMVNLSRVKEGETLLDPFSGTGSIPLEAELMGVKAICSDLSVKMCRGCKANVSAYAGVSSALVVNSDAFSPPFVVVHGISSDLPYGRCSSTLGRNEDEIIIRFLEGSKDVIEKGRYCVMMHRVGFSACEGYEVLDELRIPVHSNLTRIISILKRR